MSKLAVVIGATGRQGNSVVSALLKDSSYKVRGITRNPSSDKAKALAAKGVEITAADLNDEASLVKAFAGATVVFGVTNFVETFAVADAKEAIDIEYRHGVNIAKAASQTSTLEHYIWSTLPNSGKLTDGKAATPHADSKAAVDDFIRKDEALLAKTTFLYVTFYAGNLLYPPLSPNLHKSSGKYIWLLPAAADTPILHLGDHKHNIGVFAKAVLDQPAKSRGGKYVLASVQEKSCNETLAAWGKASGKSEQTVYSQISLEDYEKLFPMEGTEIGLMVKWWDVLRGGSWMQPDGAEMLSASDLGLEDEDFVMPKQAWAKMDWSSV